jgi:hypothetical protein
MWCILEIGHYTLHGRYYKTYSHLRCEVDVPGAPQAWCKFELEEAEAEKHKALLRAYTLLCCAYIQLGHTYIDTPHHSASLVCHFSIYLNSNKESSLGLEHDH